MSNGGLSNAQLLERFRPRLRYDSREVYFADAPQEITDLVVHNQSGGYCNALRDAAGGLIAVGDPGMYGGKYPQLDLATLGDRYPGGTPAQKGDYLQENGPQPQFDARRMHSDPSIGNRVCGRVVPDGDLVWLQYWMFFYANQIHLDEHQGDWEMIQIGIAAGSPPNPVCATLSQHGHGDTHDWNQLERRTIGGVERCIVYIARGSHAVYKDTGFMKMHHAAVLDCIDHTDGRGAVVDPVVVVMDEAFAPWASWPGVWGDTRGMIAESPLAPNRQGDRWSHPRRWAEKGRGHFWTTAMGAPPQEPLSERPAAPARPKITSVDRDSHSIMIGYRLGRRSAAPTRALRVSLYSGSGAPYTFTILVSQPEGVVEVPIPEASVDYRADVAAVSPKNAESRWAHIACPAVGGP